MEALLHMNVLDGFLALTDSLARLSEAIRQDSGMLAWTKMEGNPRETMVSAINQLQYEANQSPREIFICAGFMGASPETLERVKAVNEAKDKFKQAILQLKSAKLSATDPVLMEKFSQLLLRAPTTSNALKNMGLSRLHLKQCYRRLPILDSVPSKISWTWAHTRSIKKISLSDAQNLLQKRGNDEGIQIQLQKLGMLQPNESLAVVQELAPHLRANVVFKTQGGTKRIMIKGPMPIFFPADEMTPYPKFTPPTEKRERDSERAVRSDVKLDPIPYLPAIRAHRYR